jgi:beta-N-acetylhexosaminidase
MNKPVKAVIFGIQGDELTENEKILFAEHNPYGFILFQRNCISPKQVKQLIEQLKTCCDNPNIEILIDQEGGRVARLKEPNFKEFPSAKSFGDKALIDKNTAKTATFNNAYEMGTYLRELGITVNCAPMVDILYPYSHPLVIGDRSFSTDKNIVIELGKAYAEGLLAADIQPVIKHVPGHGRAKLDSHYDLPIIDTPLEELLKTDFDVFKELNSYKYFMTGHLLFSQIDEELPVTFSKKLISIIRNEIGFKGLIMTDDLSMNALTGDYAYRVKSSIDAGCDLLLHCNGKIEEMSIIAENAPFIK